MVTLTVYTVVAALLLLPGLVAGPSLDAAVFTLTAARMTHGAVLYVDIWDHKPPGIYLLYAAGQLLVGALGPWGVTWLIGLAVTVGLGWVVSRVMLRLGLEPMMSLLAGGAAVLVAAQYLLALGGGLTEPVATFLCAAALLLALSDGLTPWRAAVIGMLLAVALTVSLLLVVGAAVVTLLSVALVPSRGRMPVLAGLVAGGLVPIIAIAGWLTSVGALNAAGDAVFGYATAYRAANSSIGAVLSRSVSAWSILALLVPVALGTLGALQGLRGDRRRRLVTAAALAWLAGSVGAILFQGRFFAHYAIPLAVPLAILAGLGLERARRAARTALIVTLLATFAVSIGAGAMAGVMEWRAVDLQKVRSEAVGAYLRSATGPRSPIMVWGNAPQVYLAANRPPAMPYTFLYPLTTHGYSTKDQVADLVRMLVQDPPAAIVDAGSDEPGAPGFLPLLVPRPVATDGRDLDLLDPLRSFVASRYAPVQMIDGWIIYLPRG